MTQAGKWMPVGLSLIFAVSVGWAAPRQHTVVLGPWRSVSVITETGKAVPVKLRKLLLDGKFREHTAGPSHDVSDRLFVVRKATQLNDSLPQDTAKTTRWIWRMEGWISVDRQTGHVSQLNLPMFDQDTSEVSWYRDLAAYCGTSDDHNKAYLMVFQIGRRKPLLKKEFAGEPCPAPTWERQPTRVTFLDGQTKSTFVVAAHGSGLQPDTKSDVKEDDEDESE